ncbi:MAG: cytochrome c nitrite reductase small subunit [Ancrocorticia populi]|uniref:cytochrome c nitrite reductase small subunit n=1 Tax=Ancrocorticia populi TaxID=2175228 RepID=UPI003F8DC580
MLRKNSWRILRGISAMEGHRAKRKRSGASILAFIAVFAVGMMIGLAAYTFVYAKGFSYLSSDPEACINCHIMEDQYDAWQAGVHSDVATCADCHLPHDNVVHKFYVKAEDGFLHGLKFTTGWHPEKIEARDSSLEITNTACLECHADITSDIRHLGYADNDEVFDCVRCHSGVGHDD